MATIDFDPEDYLDDVSDAALIQELESRDLSKEELHRIGLDYEVMDREMWFELRAILDKHGYGDVGRYSRVYDAVAQQTM